MQNNTKLIHGGDWAGYSAEHDGDIPLDFSANVSPYGVPQGVKAAIADALHTADRYPDPLCRKLCAAIAKKEGVPEEQILCGNGAADLIFRAVLAQKPKRALVLAPTFAEYEAALKMVNCEVRHLALLPENDFSVDKALVQEITPEIDIVFLCQPNNPTGTVLPRRLLYAVADRCRRCGAVLVLDECFVDFLDAPSAVTMKDALQQYPNLLLLKAFTKLYGMAGVRLGYCLCADTSLLARLRAAGQPWAVSSLAEAAGIAALEENEYVKKVRELIGSERPWLADALRSLGLRVIPGQANYLLFCSVIPLEEPLRKKGILVRSCANYIGLDESWYRVAVRTHAENVLLIASLREALA